MAESGSPMSRSEAFRSALPAFLFFLVAIWVALEGAIGQPYIRRSKILSAELETSRTLSVNYPAFVSIGDQHTIQITAANQSDEEITPVTVILAYSGNVPVGTPPDKQTSVEFDSLNPHERSSKDVIITIWDEGNHYFTPPSQVVFDIWVNDDNGLLAIPDLHHGAQIAPIHRVRSFYPAIAAALFGVMIFIARAVFQSFVKPPDDANTTDAK